MNAAAPKTNGWLRFRAQVLALKPCRVAALLVLGGLVFLLLAPQAEDVMRALAEQHSADGNWSQSIWFFLAFAMWTLSAWYWARVMLRLEFPGVPGDEASFRRARNGAPRALGIAAALGVAVAFFRASLGYETGEHDGEVMLLQVYGGLGILGAIAMWWFTLARPTIAARLGITVEAADRRVYGTKRLRDLTVATYLWFAATLGGSAILLVIFMFWVQQTAPAMGTAAIVLFAAAGWIAAGSMFDYAGMKWRFPVFTALLAWVALCSFWNDNHEIRTLPAQALARPSLRQALDAWMDRHKARLLADKKARVPLYVVDAEGGGIRAAYWTASVLGEIQNEQPCFASHLFSLSGVSGGSLGASVFVAVLVQSRSEPDVAPCGTARTDKSFDFKAAAQDALDADFLSPVTASLLYPDLVQRFSPKAFPSFDRARTIEQSWERAWEQAWAARHAGVPNRLREPLDALWADKAAWTPALFLNATWVEAGKRIVASNVRIAATKDAEDFVDVEDAQKFFGEQSRTVSLSTAAHLSARFTYVSPAGTLVKDGVKYGRVVDGGYFENSGATTSLEILKDIDALASDDDPKVARLWQRVDTYVIHISNEPAYPRLADDRLLSAPDNKLIRPSEFLSEALAPVQTLLHTRGARGVYARKTIMWHVSEANFLHFGLCRRSSNPPLGWVLAGSTRKRMEAQLATENCPGPKAPIFDNHQNVLTIARTAAGI